MRDIRPDLRERLASIVHDRAILDEEEAGVKAFLRIEERRWQFGPPPDEGGAAVDADNGNDNGTPLTRAIRSALRAKRSLTVEELKTAVKDTGYDFGERSPGRVLHWGLVGMGRAVEKVGEKWRLKEVTQ